VKTCSSLVRSALLIALAGILMPTAAAVAQKADKQQQPVVSAARVSELMKQALEQVQGGQAAAPGQPAAQAPRPTFDLKVEDAVTRAIENNISLASQRLNPQIQDLSLASIRAAYRPTVTANFTDSGSTSTGTSTLSGGSSVTSGTYDYNGSVSQTVPWTGASTSLSWSNRRNESNNNNATFNPSYTSSFQASVTQPLWRNFRIDGTRNSLWQQLITRQLADVTLRASTLTTVANTRNAYWDYVYAIQALDVAKQSKSLADKLVQDNQARVEIGTLAPLDVITAQAQAASSQVRVVQAEQTRQQAEISLKRLIVSSTQDPLWNSTVNPVDRPETMSAPPGIDLEAAIRTALEKRTDLVTSRENLRKSDLALKYSRNQTLPQADVTASYGANGTGGDQFERSSLVGGQMVLVSEGGWADAVTVMRKVRQPSWSVRLSFSYPIGTSAADASYASARVTYQQSQATLKAQELSVATDVTTAALNVQNTWQQVQSARVARELAQRQLEAEQSKFEVGMQTSYYVVNAQNNLLSAQTSELSAILAYRKALVNFQLVQETPASGGA
jgi:outer membrane protein TolC